MTLVGKLYYLVLDTKLALQLGDILILMILTESLKFYNPNFFLR